jgi:type IV pilus assembly protein PilW
MNQHIPAMNAPHASTAAGFTLVELLVALFIALFLIAGLTSMVQGTSKTAVNQAGLAQLQNSQRIAVTLLTDVIQQAGYYPTTQTDSLQTAFPIAPALPGAPAPAFAQAGTSVVGETNATANGDSVTVRYQNDSTGTVLNCLGQSASAAPQVHEYTFSVNSTNQLVCAVDDNAPVALVANVRQLQIFYGVDATSQTPYSGTPANAYVAADQMTPTNWTNVSSVKVIITFVNPLAGQPGQSSAPQITFSRVVGVMARTGVNVVTET